MQSCIPLYWVVRGNARLVRLLALHSPCVAVGHFCPVSPDGAVRVFTLLQDTLNGYFSVGSFVKLPVFLKMPPFALLSKLCPLQFWKVQHSFYRKLFYSLVLSLSCLPTLILASLVFYSTQRVFTLFFCLYFPAAIVSYFSVQFMFFISFLFLKCAFGMIAVILNHKHVFYS